MGVGVSESERTGVVGSDGAGNHMTITLSTGRQSAFRDVKSDYVYL